MYHTETRRSENGDWALVVIENETGKEKARLSKEELAFVQLCRANGMPLPVDYAVKHSYVIQAIKDESHELIRRMHNSDIIFRSNN